MNFHLQKEEKVVMEAQVHNIVKNLQGVIKNKEAIIEDIIITFNEPYFKTLQDMDKFKEVSDTKQLRKDIDEILQRVKGLDKSRETSLVITKLQEATMWLGMNLKRLGEADPYPESRNPDSQRIEPTADGLKC